MLNRQMSAHQGLIALLLTFLTILYTSPTVAAIAEEPIYGGLGVLFGKPLPDDAIGAEIQIPPESTLPANKSIESPELKPGEPLPWRLFNQASLPRPLRKFPTQSYIMLDENNSPMRVMSQSSNQGCGESFDWLKATLSKKYNVEGDPEIDPPAKYERALRIEFLSKQIEARCGPHTIIDYMDSDLIKSWSKKQSKAFAVYQREQAAIEKRRLVLKRRQAIKFADTFTLGDQYRLEGAFGIQFQRPFAKNSSQEFPIDEPFIAVLPNLPTPFDEGDIQLVISPEKHPIIIRGTFDDIAFDDLAKAFKAKYGHPMKASKKHIIHKISGNHAIVKRLSEHTVELAFIDTAEQSEQRERLWNKESEGL